MIITREQFGQGLLETTVAIGVIVTGLLGGLSLIIASLAAGKQTADQIIASNLALEGLEVVRNIRDSNYLAGVAWDAGLAGPDTTAIAVFDEPSSGWSLNFGPNSLDDPAAQFFRDAGVYRQNIVAPPGQATNFSRLLTIDPEGTIFRKNVISQVRWLQKGVSRSVTAQTRIFDWK